MKVISGANLQNEHKLVATVGFFVGVHMGHQHLIGQVVDLAKKENLHSAVITFRNHPRKVVHLDYVPELLTTFEERIQQLSLLGIDYCVVLDFDNALAQLTAQEFITQVLSTKLAVSTLVIGYDHRFGKNRSESFSDYVQYGQAVGINMVKSDVFCFQEINISSSIIRHSLTKGRVGEVAQYLQRPYSIVGHVVEGLQLGRQIGYPTANIKLDEIEKIIPASGVYAVVVRWSNQQFGGMLNIGVRPTVSDKNEISIEVNLFDFSGNLYNETLEVQFIEKLRDERKMNGLDDLKQQLALDKELSLSILNKKSRNPIV
jgi:riboflavin kinase/FMN adenylyltransferase